MYEKQYLICSYTLESYFNNLLQSISDLDLPSYLKNFSEFQALESNFLIRALYDIATKQTKVIVVEGIYSLISQFILFRSQGITRQSLEYILLLSEKINLLKGKNVTSIDLFMREVNSLLSLETLKKNANSSDVIYKINQLFQIVQAASNLYYQATNAEKETLKTYLLSVSPSLLKNTGQALAITIQNLDSKSYSSCLTIIQTNLDKLSTVKGVKTLLGENFLFDLQKQRQCISSIQEMDQFLAYDFSKSIQKKQENKILVWLRIFSEMDTSLLETRFTYAFKYYSQINAILSNRGNAALFIKKVTPYYQRFQQELLVYFKSFKANNQNSTLLPNFCLMFLTIDDYYACDQKIRLQLEANINQISEKAGSNLYKYFSFYIELLNYIPFVEGKALTVKENELRKLLLKLTLIDIENSTENTCLEYLIRENAEKLLEYFVKKMSIPTFHSIIFETDPSIQELAAHEKSIQNILSYLTELEVFYNTFFRLIQKLYPVILQNEILKSFENKLCRAKNYAVQQLSTTDELLQEKLSLLTEKTVSVIVSHFESMNKKLEIIEKSLQNDLENELYPLIAKTIPVIITYFRLNALGHFQTTANNYVKNYSYQSKLKACFSALTENFPVMDLSLPKTWENLLQAVFLDKKAAFDCRALIFIVGFYYEEKKAYQVAREFYTYCLSGWFFETPTKENKGLYLIEKALISKHMKFCEEKLKSNASNVINSPIPLVFQSSSLAAHGVSHDGINAAPQISLSFF